MGEECVKQIAFNIIGDSEMAARIAAMKDGEKARLPSQHGLHCVVRRYLDCAVVGVVDQSFGY